MSARMVEKIAADWVLKIEDGLSADDQSRFDAWLDEATEHRIALWRLQHGWSKADRLASLRSPPSPPLSPSRRIGRFGFAGFSPRLVGLAASVLVALAAGLVAWPRPDLYETQRGEQRQVALADGSQLNLNTETRLRAEISDDRRQAWLDEGEAYFSVAHDAERPFSVHMGDRTVRVLGTRFTIRRHGEDIRVVVEEGVVTLEDGDNADHGTLVLRAGDVVSAEGVSVLRRRESTEDIAAELAWRQGLLVFDQVTLSEAAREFNRYNETQIEIGDAEAGAVRIGGTFEAANAAAFARLLRSAYGLKIEDQGHTIIISN